MYLSLFLSHNGFTDIVDLLTFPVALTGKETGVKRYILANFQFANWEKNVT